MRILFFGDVVAKNGLLALEVKLDELVRQYDIDFVIANGENVSGGLGLTYHAYERLLRAGAECVTLGNHYRGKKEIDDYIEDADRLVRPANLLHYDLGEGYISYDIDGSELIVVNMMGQAFIQEEVSYDLAKMQEIIDAHPDAIFFVDYHGEATSEKSLFAHYFDGVVAAVVGTHTHVQTSDARVLPKGTAFISDVGCCGVGESILGFAPDAAIDFFLFNRRPFRTDEGEDGRLNCVVVDIDESTRLARSIQALDIYVSKEEMRRG